MVYVSSLLWILMGDPRIPSPYDMASVSDLVQAQRSAHDAEKAVRRTKKMLKACDRFRKDGVACKYRARRAARAVEAVNESEEEVKSPLKAIDTRLKLAEELVADAEKRVGGLPSVDIAKSEAKQAEAEAKRAEEQATPARKKADEAKLFAAVASKKADDKPTDAALARDARDKGKAAEDEAKTADKLAKIAAEAKSEAADKQRLVERASAAGAAKTEADEALKAVQDEKAAADKALLSDRAARDAGAKALASGSDADKRASEDAKTLADDDAKKAEGATVRAREELEEAEDAAALAEATDEAAAASEAEEKKDDESDAKKELEKLKAGKLIRWGITAGIAPAFYQPFHYSKKAASVPGMGALTYVMLHPGYWRSRPETNIYCANRYIGQDAEDAASAAADNLSKDRAKLIIERLLASAKVGVLKKPGAAREIMCARNNNCVSDEREVRALANKVNAGGDDAEAARTTLTAIVQRETFDWRSGIAARCGSRMLGMWFGYPIKYTATIPHLDKDGKVERSKLDVTPIFATGLGVSPNAYISLLAGISLGKVNLPPADDDEEWVVSFLFGLGGNLDLIGLLTKAK